MTATSGEDKFEFIRDGGYHDRDVKYRCCKCKTEFWVLIGPSENRKLINGKWCICCPGCGETE